MKILQSLAVWLVLAGVLYADIDLDAISQSVCVINEAYVHPEDPKKNQNYIGSAFLVDRNDEQAFGS